MPASVYAYGDGMFRVDDGVLEVFSRSVQGSVRVPVVWLGVSFEDRKNDVLRVQIGLTSEGAPFYGDRLISTGPLTQLDVPASEGPHLRAFFDEIAHQSGRAG